MTQAIEALFEVPVSVDGNYIHRASSSAHARQNQTTEIFSEKWKEAESSNVMDERGVAFQKRWYLALYGFESEAALGAFLRRHRVVLDAGCGLGYKAAWFAELAPESLVLGMDFSEAAEIAAAKYADLPNLFFVRGDIADTGCRPGCIDYVSCDQVLHHTEHPEQTFAHLVERIRPGGEFACYVYAKKALPRELVDDYFRIHAGEYSKEELWALSEQLTELGKRLSALQASFECPDIPLLGIQGGQVDVQRFLYWNFLKCFWNEELGQEYSRSTNFDWFAPSNAARYSAQEFAQMVSDNGLETLHFHSEQACHSGRFRKPGA